VAFSGARDLPDQPFQRQDPHPAHVEAALDESIGEEQNEGDGSVQDPAQPGPVLGSASYAANQRRVTLALILREGADALLSLG